MSEPKNELQKNAIARARRKELETFQLAMDVQWLNSRMEDGRMGRCLALIKKEAEMEREYQERTDHAAIVNARVDKEIALGIEVSKVRDEEQCQLLRRHLLRERDPELRSLVTKLSAGYTCRDLRQQMAHNEHRRLQEKAEERHANSILSGALFNNAEADEFKEKEKREKCAGYSRELQSQLVNRQLQRQCHYEDSLVEKKMLEEVMRTLADEDQRELQQKRMLKERTRDEMVTFQKAREAWKNKHTQMVIKEERDIEEQKKALSDRTTAIVEERARKLREKEESNQRIAAKVLADEATRQERENIIKSLQEQEFLEKNANDDINEKQKLESSKRRTKDALTEQMETKKQLISEQKIRDANFRKETEANIAAANEEDREKVRRQREKGRAYSSELLRQIEDNARRRVRQREDDQARAQYVFDCDKAWSEEVSAERERIIKSHAAQLVGHLQAGVLRRGDLPAARAGAAARPELAGLPLDKLGAAPKRTYRPKCNPQCMLIRDY